MKKQLIITLCLIIVSLFIYDLSRAKPEKPLPKEQYRFQKIKSSTHDIYVIKDTETGHEYLYHRNSIIELPKPK